MKETICTVAGLVGSAFATLFGGWSIGLTTLIICMAVDYATGLIVAGVFKRSNKTANGALESRAGFKGLCRKGLVLCIVLLAYRLDLQMGTTYIQDAVIIGFLVNEILSIAENSALMGVPMPKMMLNAIEVLRKEAK